MTCAEALAGVGNVQIGTSAPAALTTLDVPFALAIDKITISNVPEPGTALLAAFGLLGIGWQISRQPRGLSDRLGIRTEAAARAAASRFR